MGDATHRAAGPELAATTLYRLLRLRVDVFVVEQRCAYPELDGRDLDPGTVHLWTGDPSTSTGAPAPVDVGAPDTRGAPTAYLRLLTEPGGVRRIGRVCTARAERGRGLTRALLTAALREIGDADCVLDAQAHLTALYGGFGFTADGPGYDWDGVLHVPMRRAGRAPTRTTAEEDTRHE